MKIRFLSEKGNKKVRIQKRNSFYTWKYPLHEYILGVLTYTILSTRRKQLLLVTFCDTTAAIGNKQDEAGWRKDAQM